MDPSRNGRMQLAPIVLFVYNRPEHTRQTVRSLEACELAKESTLLVFSDGAKDPQNLVELELISEVRSVIQSCKSFAELQLIERSSNLGLANSIVDGVTRTINQYGKVIVLEDDIVVQKGFLEFMNGALNMYQTVENVYQISGHSFPLGLRGSKQTYFLRYASPWGWATWKNRWMNLILDPQEILDELKKRDFDMFDFNSGYGNEFYAQLIGNIEGRLKTWAVKWHSTIYLNRGLTLFPTRSLVTNIGFDGSGTNCPNIPDSQVKLGERVLLQSIPIRVDDEALRKFHHYYLSSNMPSFKRRIANYYKTFYGRFQSIIVGGGK